MATLYSISEQILRRLKGGRPDAATGIDIREIKVAIVQALNALLKTGHYQGTMAEGQTIPEGAIMATYENIPVETYQKNKSIFTLPCMPVSLPMNMGLFEVKPSQKDAYVDGFDTVTNTDPFIPLRPNEYGIALGANLLNELGDFVGYEQNGLKVIVHKNLPVQLEVNKVDVKLVADISKLSDYEPLPIYPDYEALIIETVFKQFLGEGMADPDIDNVKENK